MAYIALYRKWRPQDFNNLIGQEHIRKTLANAIEQGKVAHAYLFSGSRGTGKTSTAKILAKALNCEHGPTATPCNHCSCCEKINNGSFMDVFEIDAASNRGIDEIRELRETVKFAPVDGRYKVYIIDEVHMLTTEAFNALLKTLEEPPSHVVFILATTEVHKVPITIQSRCQRYDFKRITKEDILARLKEVMASTDLEVEEAALELIAIQSDGGMRDALSILDQCLAFADGKLTVEEVHKVLGLVGNNCIWQLTDQIIAKQENDILNTLNELIGDGKDFKQILSEFILHLRSLMIYKATGRMVNMEVYLEDEAVLKRQAELLRHKQITSLIQLANETLNNLKWAPNGRIAVETMFLKMCWQESDGDNPQIEYSKGTKQENNGLEPEQQNYLLGKIQSMEQIIKALSQEINELKKNPRTVVEGSNAGEKVAVAPREGNPGEQITKLPPSTATVSSDNILATLANIAPPVTNNMPLGNSPRVAKSNTSTDNELKVEVPGELRMVYNGNIYQLWQKLKLVVRKIKASPGLIQVVTNDNNSSPYQLVNNQFFINTKLGFAYDILVQNARLLEECIRQLANIDVQIVPMFDGKIKDRKGTTMALPEAVPSTMAQDLPPVEPVVVPEPAPPEEDFMAIPDIPPPVLDDDYFVGDEALSYAPPVQPKEEVVINKDDNALDKAKALFDAEDYEVVEEEDGK